jgi:hypothetical protein
MKLNLFSYVRKMIYLTTLLSLTVVSENLRVLFLGPAGKDEIALDSEIGKIDDDLSDDLSRYDFHRKSVD